MSALKQKIDSLERNLVSIIERKLDEQQKEQLKAADARSKTISPDTEYLLKKIDDIEKKVLEFNQNAVLAAAEIKKGDELKTGALKELEPLLDALRGQFDRTTARLDDLDKKVTSLFGLAAAGQAEAAKARDEAITKLAGTGNGLAAGLAGLQKDTADRLASMEKALAESLARVERKAADISAAGDTLQARNADAAKAGAVRDEDLGARLEKLARKMHDFYEISRIEQSARDAAGKLTDVSVNKLAGHVEELGKEIADLKSFVAVEEARATEAARTGASITKESLEELGKKLEYFSKLTVRGQARKEDEERATRDELRKKIDQLAEAFKKDSRLVADRLSVGEKRTGDLAQALDKALPEKYFAELKASADAMLALREEFREQSEDFTAVFETFNRLADEYRVRAGLLEKTVSGNDRLLQEAFEKIGQMLGRNSAQFLADLKEKNRAQLETLNSKYADALANMRSMDAVYSSLDAVSRRLDAYQKKFEGFLTAVDKEQLSAVLGVSGVRIRKNLDAVGEMLSEMKHEAAFIDGVKKDMGDRLKEAFKKPE